MQGLLRVPVLEHLRNSGEVMRKLSVDQFKQHGKSAVHEHALHSDDVAQLIRHDLQGHQRELQCRLEIKQLLRED